MPIEIRELVIKTTFEAQDKKIGSSAQQLADIKHVLVKECVDEILEILKDKLER
jgi:hypothetical protein